MCVSVFVSVHGCGRGQDKTVLSESKYKDNTDLSGLKSGV